MAGATEKAQKNRFINAYERNIPFPFQKEVGPRPSWEGSGSSPFQSEMESVQLRDRMHLK